MQSLEETIAYLQRKPVKSEKRKETRNYTWVELMKRYSWLD